MTYSPISTRIFLSALTLAMAIAGASWQPALAQTADDVICKGCVDSSDIANDSIRQNDIRDNAINRAKIAANAVGGSEVRSDSIGAGDLSAEAGADFSSGNQTVSLPTLVPTVLRSVTITAPKNGIVIVNAGGAVDFDSAAKDSVACSITTGVALDFTHQISMTDDGIAANKGAAAYAATRGFNVAAGSTTFNLVCREFLGTVQMHDTSLTAMYFPTKY